MFSSKIALEVNQCEKKPKMTVIKTYDKEFYPQRIRILNFESCYVAAGLGA